MSKRKIILLRIEVDEDTPVEDFVAELRSNFDYENIDATVEEVKSFDHYPERIRQVLNGDSGDAEADLLVDIRDSLMYLLQPEG